MPIRSRHETSSKSATEEHKIVDTIVLLDRTIAHPSPAIFPKSIQGCDWIRPIIKNPRKPDYSVDPIATFKVTADAEVFVAHDERIAQKPDWLKEWADTGESLKVCSGVFKGSLAMKLYSRKFKAGETVTLGANSAADARGPRSMYITFIKPAK